MGESRGASADRLAACRTGGACVTNDCLSLPCTDVRVLAMSAIQPSSPTQADASFRAAVRLLASLMPDAPVATGSEPPLEALAQSTEPPRTVDAILIEDGGGAMRAHRVFEPPVVQFAAFLDGTQASRTLYSCDDGTPIVHGTAAAVIRERRNKRL